MQSMSNMFWTFLNVFMHSTNRNIGKDKLQILSLRRKPHGELVISSRCGNYTPTFLLHYYVVHTPLGGKL